MAHSLERAHCSSESRQDCSSSSAGEKLVPRKKDKLSSANNLFCPCYTCSQNGRMVTRVIFSSAHKISWVSDYAKKKVWGPKYPIWCCCGFVSGVMFARPWKSCFSPPRPDLTEPCCTYALLGIHPAGC